MSGGGAPSPTQHLLAQEDDPDFFDKLEGDDDALLMQGAGQHMAQPPAGQQPDGAAATGVSKAGADGPVPVTPAEAEDEILRALTVGNYAAAVEAAFRAGRHADALLIANTGGRELYTRTLGRYVKAVPRPYQSIVMAAMDGDYAAMIRSRPVAQWKDTLAMLATYTDRWRQGA